MEDCGVVNKGKSCASIGTLGSSLSAGVIPLGRLYYLRSSKIGHSLMILPLRRGKSDGRIASECLEMHYYGVQDIRMSVCFCKTVRTLYVYLVVQTVDPPQRI